MNLDQIKKELFAFNPSKPFRKDDCIDAIASCINHNEVMPPPKQISKPLMSSRGFSKAKTWRI